MKFKVPGIPIKEIKLNTLIHPNSVCNDCARKCKVYYTGHCDFKLNENELKVLKSLVESSAGNGHDFGFTDEYKECGLTKHQTAGYIGQLITKKYINACDNSYDPGSECNGVQFNFTLKGENLLNDLGFDIYVDNNH